MRTLISAIALLALSACATAGTVGNRMDWRCDGGAAFSTQIKTDGHAEVFAGGQVYALPHVAAASGARYAEGSVEYWERGGQATLTGARGGPYENCRRR
ncbi:MAG: MliC family protein [Hyphomonadaceae bacterium]|nr:MliC family protein [Hyphomonadaceae bacterium]